MTQALLEKADWTQLEPSQENADKYFPPADIGPIWLKDTWGNWLLPEYTIGWDAIAWAEMNLSALRGGGPLELTPEQMRVMLWHYAIDETGEFTYEYSVYQAFKGAGKDPFGAVMAIIELIGPCRFSHWIYDGEGSKSPAVTDEPDALVQLVGVAKAQTHNTMVHIPKLLNKRVRAEYGLDVQKENVYVTGTRKKLQMVGSSPGVLEGNPSTFALANETQHWLPSQGGEKLWETIYDNVGKVPNARLMAITNAFMPGEESIAEAIRTEQEKVWAGLKEPSGCLYMSREAHPEAPLHPDWVPFIMERIIGDAWWQRKNIRSIISRVLDGSRPPSRTRRMYYNQVVTSEDAFFSPAEITGARREGAFGDKRDLSPGDEITLGFDGGKTDDATALVAIRIKDKLIVPLLVLQKPDGPMGEGWRVSEQEVNEAVMEAFDVYSVRAFYADPALWQSWISTWNESYREQLGVRASGHSSIAWEMSSSNQKIGRAWESFYDAIRTKRLHHNGNRVFELHAINARRGRGRGGLIARKDNPESPRKIDAMVAAYIAYAALEDYLQKGKKQKTYRRQMLRG